MCKALHGPTLASALAASPVPLTQASAVILAPTAHPARHSPASGPLHLLSPLQGMPFLQISPLLNPSSISSLSSNIFSVWPPLALCLHLDLCLPEILHLPFLVYISPYTFAI